MINEKLMEFNKFISCKDVALLGFGSINIPLMDYLYKHGANVTIFDIKNKNELDKEAIRKAEDYGIKMVFGENYLKKLVGYDLILRSPSVRVDTPEIVKELERGAILTSESELAIDMCPRYSDRRYRNLWKIHNSKLDL